MAWKDMYTALCRLDFRRFLRGKSVGSFPEQRLVIEPMHYVMMNMYKSTVSFCSLELMKKLVTSLSME